MHFRIQNFLSSFYFVVAVFIFLLLEVFCNCVQKSATKDPFLENQLSVCVGQLHVAEVCHISIDKIKSD